MIDLRNKKCLSTTCTTAAKCPHLRGYCAKCFKLKFPEEYKYNARVKESAVVDFILKCFPGRAWVCNKTVNGGKSRPDIIIDMETYWIIIEIDEDQHKIYTKEKEQKRIKALLVDTEFRPVCLIRINPDSYKTDGTTVPSCWKKNNKTTVCELVHPEEWAARMEVLRVHVFKALTEGPETEEHIQTVKLFFDGYIANDDVI
jgi:hypothetical protein